MKTGHSLINKRARERLDSKLSSLHPVNRYAAPPKGWIRAIRDALGMNGVQLARRMNISPQALADLERSEAAGRIQIGTLRRAAEAMDCQLVYALVPRTSLEDTVQQRAAYIAEREVRRTDHTMALEDQQASDWLLEDQVRDYIETNLRPGDLWSDE